MNTALNDFEIERNNLQTLNASSFLLYLLSFKKMRKVLSERFQAILFKSLHKKIEILYKKSLEIGSEETFFDTMELIFINTLENIQQRRNSKIFGFIYRKIYPDPLSEEALRFLEDLAYHITPPKLAILREDIILTSREAFNVYKIRQELSRNKQIAQKIAQNIREAIKNYAKN